MQKKKSGFVVYMMDDEQRTKVMRLFNEGKGVSEIAKSVGVSRQSVYRVIRSDFEEDAEIRALKKELKVAELRGKIAEMRKPLRVKDDLAFMERAIDEMFCWVLALRYLNPRLKEIVPWCIYCGEALKFNERDDGKRVVPVYQCNRCNKNFVLP